MNKSEVIARFPNGTELKFLAQARLFVWEFDPESGSPYHATIADELDMISPNKVDLKPGVVSGYAKVENADLKLLEKSSQFANTSPTSEQFEKLSNNEIEIL